MTEIRFGTRDDQKDNFQPCQIFIFIYFQPDFPSHVVKETQAITVLSTNGV